MNTRATTIGATMIALTFTGMAAVQAADTAAPGTASSSASTTSLTSPGQTKVADKFAAPFVTLAGSRENAVALATALQTGSPATLTYTSTAADGTVTTTTVTITPPTKPMGWGNVSHSLALAQFALNQNGITNPTGAQLQAALNGGTFKTADGTTVTLAGVLQQRSDGMGWGRIAQSYGTTMGAVNRGIKAPITTVATATPATPVKTVSTATAPKVTTGRGVSSASGLTTASGTAASAGHGTKGLTTAASTSGSANSGGIVTANASAHGNGYAYGHGVMTASGSSAGASAGASSGMVTGAGGAAGVITADPNHGAGSVNSHGKGKGGG